MSIVSPAEAFYELENLGYTRVAREIDLLWGTPQLAIYFRELLIDSRGSRAGFPPAVFDQILKLFILHEEKFSPQDKEDFWKTFFLGIKS